MNADADLLNRVRAQLATRAREPTPATVAAILREDGRLLGTAEVLRVVEVLHREVHGAGPLDPLLAEPGITDVLVNGPDCVYVDRGEGLERRIVDLPDEGSVRRLAQRLAAIAGRRLDDSSPWVDARLPGGTRVHAVLAPLARPGTLISLRVPARRGFSLEALRAAGTLEGHIADELRSLVAAHVSFVVTGGTGTGKTTVLSALLGLVDPTERIVIAEDAAELKPSHPHVVALEARPANVEGSGLVTLRDLVRQALRMRPDRLVVGEVRGAEVVDLLAALNTGHDGGASTLHANAASAVPARFEALGVAAGLPRAAVHSQLAAGLRAVVHLERDRVSGQRRVSALGVFTTGADGLTRVEVALTWTPEGVRRLEGYARWRELLQ